jgi:hypothetical protein
MVALSKPAGLCEDFEAEDVTACVNVAVSERMNPGASRSLPS